jgi:hypothetical protein
MLHTTMTPINGKEAKEIIAININKILASTPGLDLATSYHKLSIDIDIKLLAYPADTPTPKVKRVFELLPNPEDKKAKAALDYIQKLTAFRDEVIEQLELINKELDVLNPVIVAHIPLEAGETPDALRISEGLPIPTIDKVGGRVVETYVPIDRTKTNGIKSPFGKGR